MKLNRRTFVSASVLFLTTGCVGSDGTDEPQEGEFEPVDLSVGNRAETNKTVSVEITRDNETLYSDELDVKATNISSRRITVKDVIQEEGEYVVHAEVNGMTKTERISVSDSARSIDVEFDDEVVDIAVNVNGG